MAITNKKTALKLYILQQPKYHDFNILGYKRQNFYNEKPCNS